MKKVVDKESGQVLFTGTPEECKDYICKSSNEFTILEL